MKKFSLEIETHTYVTYYNKYTHGVLCVFVCEADLEVLMLFVSQLVSQLVALLKQNGIVTK